MAFVCVVLARGYVSSVFVSCVHLAPPHEDMYMHVAHSAPC